MVREENTHVETALTQETHQYQGPEIIEAGSVVALTGAINKLVRDNPMNDNPHYYDASEFAPDTELEIDDL